MTPPRIRPRFEIASAGSPSDLIEGIRTRLDQATTPVNGQIAGTHIHLRVPRPEQRIWSPHLYIEIVPTESGSLLLGHFGPHPDVWTFVVALYAILGFVGTVGLIFGGSQWMLGTPPVAMWVAPVAIVLAAVLYVLSLIGQHLGHDQMRQLRAFIEESIS